MLAFTRLSRHLRRKVWSATLRSLHNNFPRLVLIAKIKVACTKCSRYAIHKRLRTNPKDGTNLLKFVYGQLRSLNMN
jgi:hypothetical protein